VKLTARDIEIAVARHFGYRVNLVVPNVSWGWGLRHEADMIVLRPSGLCDEIEIKTTASDIRADAKKRVGHWESSRIARVWFAVPHTLADHPDIPAGAGVLSVMRAVRRLDGSGRLVWMPATEGNTCWHDHVAVVRTARLRKDRVAVTAEQRLKLAELGSMRIWDLKSALSRKDAKV
jgi:hypothetical protein